MDGNFAKFNFSADEYAVQKMPCIYLAAILISDLVWQEIRKMALVSGFWSGIQERTKGTERKSNDSFFF